MRFRKYLLTEKTAQIGADVDMIFKKAFLKYEKIFKKDDMRGFIKAMQSTNSLGGGKFVFVDIKSSELKSRDGRIAHDINPVRIRCGLLDGSSYVPSLNLINISLNMNATGLMILNKVKTIKDVEALMPMEADLFERFKNEFSGKSIKGSIYHELAHWIDDSKHNFHITKGLKKSAEIGNTDNMKRDGSNLFTDYEIEAQVHAIKQLKREFNKSWDVLSWNDIIQFKPSFNVIKTELHRSGSKVQKNYHKRMVKRLNREKLLGKLMQKTFVRDMIQ